MFLVPTQSDKDRFFSNIQRSENGCWMWIGYKMKNGYGQLHYQKKVVYAHRLSYFIHKGEFDASLCLCHKCDTPACCNPDHMFLGTRTDNANDKVAKQRHAVGQAVGGLFSETDIRTMFALYRSGMKQSAIARRYKTNPAHVSNIINGHKWGHLGLHLGTENAI